MVKTAEKVVFTHDFGHMFRQKICVSSIPLTGDAPLLILVTEKQELFQHVTFISTCASCLSGKYLYIGVNIEFKNHCIMYVL